MEKQKLLYEGKAKQVYETDDPDLLIQYFKDDATAFNAQKKGTISDKGVLNNQISSTLLELLEARGIATHFVRVLNPREMLVRRLSIIPVETIVRNIAAGSLCKRLGLPEGQVFSQPIVEFCYKSDPLGDPIINYWHILALDMATEAELTTMTEMALKVNSILQSFFSDRGIILVDFKLEFGRCGGQVLLGDEISPDTCRFWDKSSGEKLDKDRFRQDLGRIEEAYQEIHRRVCG